ncbi:MAG: NADPH:quinone oxidoreductase family protein [bacterium]|nr:NADPH:quinone oxidoreductase family protein [bacterium]
MRAMICNAWGDPSTLVMHDIEGCAPGEGEVRLRVRACGVNFADTLMIAGQYQVRPPFPFSPGMEIAGEVMDVGEGVRHLKSGDRVMGICDWGGLAEEVTTKAAMLLPMPPNMDFPTAAAFPIAYGTSHLALDHRGGLKAGETLLVLGAAGGVGLTAVEIGSIMGATVIAAASTPEKLALAQQYGAAHLINYSSENLRDRLKEIVGSKGVNVIYDPVGGDLFEQALRSVAWEGRALVIGFASGTIPQVPANLALVKNCSIVGVFWGAYAGRDPQVLSGSLRTLLSWYSEGKLKPYISATYPLEQTAEAYHALMRRQSTGKVVITL